MTNHREEPKQTVGELTRLTSWAMLLSHWTSFARHSVALPENEEGKALRESVVPLIGLQAHVFALAELGELPEDERALGLDRASVGIDGHERTLREAWEGSAMPEGITDLLIDARTALRVAGAGQAG